MRRVAPWSRTVALWCGLVLVGCALAPPGPVPPVAEVTEVHDGDTISARLGGRTEIVRLLGIDTPETVHPDKPVECHGPEASAALVELLPLGSEIRLERDAEPRDRYGRLLAYVFRTDDDLFVNEELVRAGHAAILSIDPNHAYDDRLAAAERQARDDRRGLWAHCGGPHQPRSLVATPG